MERRQHEVAVRWRELPGCGRDAERRIETAFETRPELVEIARQTVVRAAGLSGFSTERRTAPLRSMRSTVPMAASRGRALRLREGVEERRGQPRPTADSKPPALCGPLVVRGDETHARVARRWLGADQSLLPPRVVAAGGWCSPSPGPDGPAAAGSRSRPPRFRIARGTRRAIRGAAEKAPSQRSDLLGDRAIEAPHLGDAIHISDVSQRYGRRQAIGLFPWAARPF